MYQVLLNAAQKHVDPALPATEDQPADAYLTLVGYFNALRELGAMRRVVEDEVPQRTAKLDGRGTVRQRKAGLGHPLMAPRTLDGPIELTSRESTAKVKQAKHRLAVKFKPPFTGDARGVDVVLASNMISVGVDIDRLGLMVVAGQPTTSSEYIQATSRVGRNRHRPGLVVTCYNMRRMRDRSYFERFVSYHQSFYGWVEATSVTPFSQPALDRALAAVLVAMVRHGDPALSPASGAMQVGAHRAVIARAVAALRERAGRQVDADAEGLADIVARRAQDLADSWCSQVDEARAENIKRGYSRFDLDKKGLARPLLMSSLDVPLTPVDAKFVAPTSMRDTEPAVHLWLRYGLGRKQV